MTKPVALAITTLTLPAMKVGVAGSTTIAVKGGTPPYRLTMAPAIPGFSLSGAKLSWLPQTADSFGFTITVIDAKGRPDNQGYKVIIAEADPVVTPPPPVPAPPPPPPPTGEPAPATGLEWRKNGPTRPIMSAWNWDIAAIKRLAGLGLVNVVGYDRIDWCDGAGSREPVLSTLASFGLKAWGSPGLQSNGPLDYRSTAVADAADPRWLFTALMDEPNQNGVPIARQIEIIDQANADVIAAGGTPMPWEVTHPLMAAYYSKPDPSDGFRQWFDQVGGRILLFGMDAYPNAEGQSPLMGRHDYVAMNPGWGPVTGTCNSFMINGHLHGPHVTGETISQGRFAYAWLQASIMNRMTGRPLPSYGDMTRLFWGIYVPGGHGHGWFDTNDYKDALGVRVREIGAFDPILIPYAQELTRQLLFLNDTLGCLMDPVWGGRTPYTRRMGAPVTSGPSTGVGPATDTGVEAYQDPTPDQMPKLFEGTLLKDRHGNPVAYLILNLSSNPNTLNDPVWGFTDEVFAGKQAKLLDYATRKPVPGWDIGFVPDAAAKPQVDPAAKPSPSTAGVVGVDLSAVAQAKAGDTVYLKPGYHVGRLNQLVFAAPVTINSADPANPAVIADYFEMASCAGIVLDGVNFEHRDDVVDPYGRRLNNCQRISILRADMKGYQRRFQGQFGLFYSADILIDQCEVHDGVTGFGHLGCQRLKVSRNYFHDSQADAIAGCSAQVTIDANYFTNFHSIDGDHPDCVQFYEDWSTSPSGLPRDVVVTNNLYIRGSGTPAEFVFIRMTDHLAAKLENVTVRDNVAIGPQYHGVTVIGGRNVIIERNVARPLADLGTFVWVGGADGFTSRDNQMGDFVYGWNEGPQTQTPATSNAGAIVVSGNRVDPSVAGVAEIAAIKAAWKAKHPDVRTD